MNLLEPERPFSQSMLWALQRRYFAERGVDAWRRYEVPDYITSNPRVADGYAEMVFAFGRDRQGMAAHGEPLHVVELGAGSGRFAFHFLSRLGRLCEQAGVAPQAFRYVLTDQAESNLQHWRGHARFRPFFEQGLLDLAAFEIGTSSELELRVGGRTLGSGSLAQPPVVIANYVFDSIPQDLFHIGEGTCDECLVALAVHEDPGALDAAGLLSRLGYRYERRPLAGPPYAEPWLQEMLADYQRALSGTHLLFPATALRCLERLRALSRQGLVLLTADKGDHRLDALRDLGPPKLARHVCVSLNVNYHAFKAYCERSGGLALFPDAAPKSLHVGACLMVANAPDHVETRRAYQRHVLDFGPDDFYAVVQHARETVTRMSVHDILGYLKLSHDDAQLLVRCLPRLLELAPTLQGEARRALTEALDRAWQLYFPLGEELDLADAIARLLYEMGDYRRALEYLRRSEEVYGTNPGTLANIAICRQLLAAEAQP
jgi:tetratricopeptide (TPR) repeat protein